MKIKDTINLKLFSIPSIPRITSFISKTQPLQMKSSFPFKTKEGALGFTWLVKGEIK